MKWISQFFVRQGKEEKNIKKIAEKELRENLDVIKSLREYDRGEKDIPTDKLRQRLPSIRVAS